MIKGETMNLSKEEKEELKNLYTKLHNLFKEKATLEVFKKQREDKLKDEIASVCNIIDKQGNAQGSKVKMPLVSAILDEFYKEKPNKKEEEISTYESYKLAIKNKEVSEELIKGYISSTDSIKENTENIKEAYKESSLLSKEILEALNALLKDEFKNQLNDELEKQGYEVKESKDKSELEELKSLLAKLLKE